MYNQMVLNTSWTKTPTVVSTYEMQCSVPYLTKTLRAPNGVTRVAGAKAYAAKLATSPAPTWEIDNKRNSQIGTNH